MLAVRHLQLKIAFFVQKLQQWILTLSTKNLNGGRDIIGFHLTERDILRGQKWISGFPLGISNRIPLASEINRLASGIFCFPIIFVIYAGCCPAPSLANFELQSKSNNTHKTFF